MKSKISNKTIQDLEFNSVLQQISENCLTGLGKEKIVNTLPIADSKLLKTELLMVDEFLTSFQSDNLIPNHNFDDITTQIKRLQIENSFLEPKEYLKISYCIETVNELIKFFKKFNIQFPTLSNLVAAYEINLFIPKEITQIIDIQGEIKNDASKNLKQIRKDLSFVRNKINQSFNAALSQANAAGYLDDIKETIIDNQRVLAVLAMYRRKVNGSVVGSSKSGNIIYMAPQATLQYTNEYSNLLYDEKQEIIKILRDLATNLRPYTSLLKEYIAVLTHIDSIYAKAKYAVEIDGVLPEITNHKTLDFKNAYHPLLKRKNKRLKITTIPQNIQLHKNQQIIVISGPNAGGKSITLKTVGLLQLMIQSGILIPVDEGSKTTFFETIVTDIGDNQSIENQLSTYSYRLKNMRYFLQNCDENTLFLIDEFGTGSDPELGGALAEIFLEAFYEKNSYGIITTHYSNLKVLANELSNVTNANMQFNERTLEPMYKLFIGEAGSSFTFEVAQKNGIPFNLINKAKKRVENDKVRLDKTISKLQKERNKLRRSTDILDAQKNKEEKMLESLQEKELKIQEKLADFQQLYDNNQKMLSLGRKINELLNTYFQNNNKKKFLADFNAWVTAEKIKYSKKNPVVKATKIQKKQQEKKEAIEKAELQKIEEKVLSKVVEVRIEKEKIAKQEAAKKANYVYKLNDKVKVVGSNAVGTIDAIQKNKVTINYGAFTTITTVDKIEIV